MSVIAVLVVALSSCGAAGEPIVGHAELEREPVVVGTGACRPQEAQELVEAFLASYNDPTSSGLAERFFAPVDRFQWYSDRPERLGSDAVDLATLDRYFARRQGEGDSLVLVDFDFNGFRADDDTGHFGMILSRAGSEIGGKGAIDCGSSRIVVWATGIVQDETT